MNIADPLPERARRVPRLRISRLRRLVMLAVFALFLGQYSGIELLVGSLSGSVFLGAVKLLDVFAFIESQFAARELAMTALVAVLPVVALYLIFGRAFCGWICPMDFVFSVAARVKKEGRSVRLSPKIGYGVVGAFLVGAALTGVPLFTQYLSHLTNVFRALSAASGMGERQGSLSVLLYSASVLLLLLLLEWISPRLWCRILCPVGKTYGLFNRVSLLRLHLSGEGCSGCRGCEDACCMGVQIAANTAKRELRDADCIYCGRCAEVCQVKEGVIRMRFRRQV